jgi:signal transduction histidine kinase
MPGKRTVLRTGFSIVIAVSVISTLIAFRIQETFSERTVEIHRKYVQQASVLNNIRRLLWTGGILARDFFLNTAPDRQTVYVAELNRLESDLTKHLGELRQAGTDEHAVRHLGDRVDDLLRLLRSSVENPIPDKSEYMFIQEQIVPRREAAGRVLRELEGANEAALTRSEEEFAATRRASARGLVIILGVGLLLAIFVSRFSLRYSEILERQTVMQLEEVSAAKAELERLSARLMEIQEEERTRLSRELHDEIVQTIAVLRIEITQAQQLGSDQLPSIREHLDRMRGLADRTLHTVRNITLLLRPSLLDDLGLGPALQWLTEDFRRRTKIRCDYVEEGLSEELPEALKTCVYRVTQEALHNCEKHAHATNVQVRVIERAGTVMLEVKDDGVGVGQKGNINSITGAHFGILGMRERAANLGGSLTLEQALGGGLKVTLNVPVSKALHRSDASKRAEALA